MKKGDIVRNPWVNLEYNGSPNPIAFFMYLGKSGRFVEGLSSDGKGGFERVKYYQNDFNKDLDHQFKVVGHLNLLEEFNTCYEQEADK